MNRLISLRFGLPAVVLVVLLALTGMNYLDRSENAQSSLSRRARSNAVLQAESVARLAQWDLTYDTAHVAAELSAHTTEQSLSSLALINSNTVIEMAHRSSWVGQRAQDVITNFDVAKFRRITSGRVPDVLEERKTSRIRVMVPFQTRYQDTEIRPVKRGVIYVEYDLRNEIAQAIAEARRNWLTETGFAIFFALVLSWILHQRVSRPLVRVQEASERLATHDEFDVPVPVSGPYEVRHLANAFNLMVTKLSAARQEADAGRERLVAIMDSAMDAIITADTHQRVRVINQAALRMFGYSEAQALGRPISDFMPDRFRTEHGEAMDRYGQRDARSVPHRSRRRVSAMRSNGEEFPVFAAISSLKVNGETLFTAVLHDVTQELQAENEIRALNANLESLVAQRTAKLLEATQTLEIQKAELEVAHAQLQTIFETASTGILLLNNRKIIRCNGKAEEVFGYETGEMLGLSTRCWFPDEESYVREGAKFYSQFDTHSLAVSEVQLVKKDGSQFWARESGRIFRDDPMGQELVVIVEDITQQNEAKELILKAKEEAESANQAKSYFLANMSHEIRTPMNGILGLAYILEKSNIPDEARTLVKKIRSTGADLQTIINDILDFSKIEGGHLELEKADFDLGDVLDRLATTMTSTVGDKSIELLIVPPPPEAMALNGDALRLLQVLINLAGNAIKFTHSGYVKVAVEQVTCDDLQVALRFSIHDSGIGISRAKQSRIFEPFTQADVSTTRRFGGSGLGLSISRRLVELLGGAMGVTSTEGRGSEFFFTLRFARGNLKPDEQRRLPAMEVLVAGQSEIGRAAMQATVSCLGWRPQLVSSGQAALDFMKSLAPQKLPLQVLVLDAKLAPMDGLTTVQTIQREVRGACGPVVLMVCGHNHGEIRTHHGAPRVDAILTKPVTPTSLHEAVAAALRKRLGAAQAQRIELGLRLKGLKLLVVDDSDINREVSQRIFSDEGAGIVALNDGDQALQWLLTPGNEVDLVLMDLQMPVMDGYEATREIRKHARLRQLPVIALTAGAFQSQRDAAYAAGVNDFLSKPFEVEDAIGLILKYAGSRLTPPPEHAVSLTTVVSTPVPATHRDLPGLRVGRGLGVWKDELIYKRFLRKFAIDYQDCVSVMRQANLEQVSTRAHKLLGAASNLALDDVAAAASAIDHSVHSGSCPSSSLDALQAALDVALRSIAVYSQPPSTDGSPSQVVCDLYQIAELLAAALEELGSDSPAGVEPILAELDKCLPADRLAPLRTELDNFNFRGAEAAVRTLAGSLEISLGDSA